MKYMVDINGELPKTGALRNAQRLTVHDLLDEIAGQVCDSYCKWPDLCGDDEPKLYNEHCNNCPFNLL